MFKKVILSLSLVSLTSTMAFAIYDPDNTDSKLKSSWDIMITTFSSMDNEEVDAANALAKKLVIKDHKNDPENYNLADPVLRQEIALISRRVSEKAENTTCKNLFKDVSSTTPNEWVCKNVESLVENWLISANEYFNPERNISKSEALIMFIKSIGFVDFELDMDSEKSWQEQVVEFAVEQWVVENFTDYDTEAKRGWIFKIANYSMKVKEERIEKGTWFKKDSDKISPEASF